MPSDSKFGQFIGDRKGSIRRLQTQKQTEALDQTSSNGSDHAEMPAVNSEATESAPNEKSYVSRHVSKKQS